METVAAAAAGIQCVRSLSKRTPSSTSSFRLRCPSLNSLRLRRIFDVFDKNNDNLLTVNELSQALNVLGLDADPSELNSMIQSYIKPGNPGLRFEDFEALHRSLNDAFFGEDFDLVEEQDQVNQEEEDAAEEANKKKAWREESDLTEAFNVFDEDGDGYISAGELQVVLKKLGFPEGGEMDRVERMIGSVDRNHDGRVDFFEFKDMMRSVMVRSA